MDREDFERRLLALIRHFLDQADEIHPMGFEIGEFMVLYEVIRREPEGEELPPWSGGFRAGWESPVLAYSSSASTYWIEEAFLREALAQVRRERRQGEIEDDEDVSE